MSIFVEFNTFCTVLFSFSPGLDPIHYEKKYEVLAVLESLAIDISSLCLLVYTLAQRQIRNALKDSNFSDILYFLADKVKLNQKPSFHYF
jgi:hypothetical protein